MAPPLQRGLVGALSAALQLALVSGHAGHNHGGGNSNVIDLTSTNFDEYVGGDKAAVVEFYAPWCGHCRHLRPEFEKLANTFAGSEQVIISKLNGEMFPEYGYKYRVRGFPTILWFSKDSTESSQEYWGERSAAALMNWIHTKLDDPSENPPDPDEPPPAFDLTGRWLDTEGGELILTQTKARIAVKPVEPQHWSSAHGVIKGHKIPAMPFNTVMLSATISDDANSLAWDNDVVWNRKDTSTNATQATEGDAAAALKKGKEETGATADAEVKDEKVAADAEDGEGDAGGAGGADKGQASAAAAAGVIDDSAALEQARKEAQTAAAASKKATTRLRAKDKELMASRTQTLELQTALEAKDQHIAVLYCALGVLVVLVVFLGCRGMGSAESYDDEPASPKEVSKNLL